MMSRSRKIAFCFPGQGSQTLGMLHEIAAVEPLVGDTFNEASEALNEDLWQLTQQGPAEKLQLTANAQPALLAAGVALWRLWKEKGGTEPVVMAGHSLGEFTALTCAGAIDFVDAIRLVRRRGELMQSAVPAGQGTMAAVLGLADEQVIQCCDAVSTAEERAEAVNFNAPGQVVIAGYIGAVQRAAEACREAGAKRVTPLPVSAPFHTGLMERAAEQLAAALAEIEIASPATPVVHNVNANTEQDPQQIRNLLRQQLHSPVHWTQCVRSVIARGAEITCEAGPGKVLCGLNRRTEKSLLNLPLETPADFAVALQQTDTNSI